MSDKQRKERQQRQLDEAMKSVTYPPGTPPKIMKFVTPEEMNKLLPGIVTQQTVKLPPASNPADA